MNNFPDLLVNWCHDLGRLPELVDFFVQQLDTSYISHGELIGGRADGVGHWSPNLRSVLLTEFEAALSNRDDSIGGSLAVGQVGPTLCAVGLVEWAASDAGPYLILQDIVIDRGHRSEGLGSAVVKWIESEARKRGCRLIVLETGIGNPASQAFFEKHGYSKSSIMFLKMLDF